MKKIIMVFLVAKLVFGITMSLSDCIQTAEKNNLDIKISETDKIISDHSLTDARNRFYDITGSGSYFLNGDDDNNQNTNFSASIGLSGKVSPSLFHNYEYSKISNESTDINHSDILNSIRYTVINSFFQVLIAEEKLNLQTDIAEYSQKKYEEAELKFSMGNISKSDLLSFEVSKSSDIIDLKAAESSLKKSKQTLVYHMNAKINSDSLEISYEQQAITEENFDENILIEEAFNNRPDLTLQKNYLS
ncbi:MAG: TolC family protein, partial [Candidatus Delongbacteria bacterium]|nr:TolC family protein [Candidatus Delongbacteria bacterium]MCG2760678.1 TolC family protein [Candidatus Delongbacteria bacterium]